MPHTHTDCDTPHYADAGTAADIPNPGLDMPHDMATGSGTTIVMIDTGAAVPKVTGDRDSCQLHGSAVATVLTHTAPDAKVHSIGYSPNRHETDGTLLELIESLHDAHAVEASKKIINISLVTCEDSPLLHNAIKDLTNSGALVVASAGNAGQCDPGSAVFPAAYPEVFSVGAIDPTIRTDDGDVDAEKLNAGRVPAEYNLSEQADIYAPGGPVVATVQTTGAAPARDVVGSPDPFIGTSFATPVVTASAALVWQANPLLDAAGVRNVLLTSALPATHSQLVISPRPSVTFARDALRDPSTTMAPQTEEAEFTSTTVVNAGSVQPETPDYFVPLLLAAVLATVLIVGLVARAFSSESSPPSANESIIRHGTKR